MEVDEDFVKEEDKQAKIDQLTMLDEFERRKEFKNIHEAADKFYNESSIIKETFESEEIFNFERYKNLKSQQVNSRRRPRRENHTIFLGPDKLKGEMYDKS